MKEHRCTETKVHDGTLRIAPQERANWLAVTGMGVPIPKTLERTSGSGKLERTNSLSSLGLVEGQLHAKDVQLTGDVLGMLLLGYVSASWV